MNTKPKRLGRIHYAVPFPRANHAVHALRLAHRAVDREDAGKEALLVAAHARHQMAVACR